MTKVVLQRDLGEKWSWNLTSEKLNFSLMENGCCGVSQVSIRFQKYLKNFLSSDWRLHFLNGRNWFTRSGENSRRKEDIENYYFQGNSPICAVYVYIVECGFVEIILSIFYDVYASYFYSLLASEVTYREHADRE